MDFTLTDEQQAIRDLAERILTEKLPPERLRTLEQAGTWLAEDVWQELAKAGLLGICLPEADGGGGFGLLEACLIAEQVGRTVAPIPYLAAVVGAGLPLAAFGTDAQKARHLPALADGSAIVTVALHEPNEVGVPAVPATQATPAGGGWRLDGKKAFVVGADTATAVLVPARTGEATSSVYLVDPRSPGVTLDADEAVSGEPQWTMRLAGVEVGDDDRLGTADQGAEIVGWIADRLTAAICATQTGVCEEALAITARYVNSREQFGAKLATFHRKQVLRQEAR